MGVQLPSIFLAFTAGFLSFISPCVLPLVPGYLATVTGGAPAELGSRPRRVVVGRSLTFIGTFSLVFILLGLSATAAGSLLFENRQTLDTVAGLAVMAMGVLFVASTFVTALNREWRPPGLIERASGGGPVVAGAAFAVAWTPCIGPTLAAILGLAATSSGTAQGGLLLAVYSAGLGVPFLLTAVAFNGATSAFDVLKRHYLAIQLFAGVVLIIMGYLVFSGEMFRLNVEAQRLLNDMGLDFIYGI
ncbi:cytochrome c biogenesis CcdA family protein [Svornostia abyssi]|uniref:Cytochrome c biogenesis CcdA family protein n=1 Tax=Svornostia abyssi TaxID=2898438 RepID=A0ABY5PEJ4_9ACTN|nr:cytochrome c biogenesis CcdA family protein [Parviterribacteraceae bacterium J379]